MGAKRTATAADLGTEAPKSVTGASAPAIDSAVIPGAGSDATAPALDDLDALLLGGAVAEAEGTVKEDTGKTPIITAPAELIKKFIEGSKAAKDGEAKQNAAGELLAQFAAPQRIEMSRKANAFLSSVKMVADGPVEVEKIIEGKPVKVKANVEGAVLFTLNRYTPVKPDFNPVTKKGRDAKALIAAYAATFGPDWKKYVAVGRALVAKDELLADPVLAKKAMDALKAAGLGGYFEIQYDFSPTDELHRGITMNPDLEAKFKALEGQKLVKPKKSTLKAS
jgi:hypothetical protein